MEATKDQWLWVVDEELIQSLVRNDAIDTRSEKRAVESSALARALSLNTEGKTDAAWAEVSQAIEAGEDLLELFWVKGHLEFELGRYEDAVQSYAKVLEQR